EYCSSQRPRARSHAPTPGSSSNSYRASAPESHPDAPNPSRPCKTSQGDASTRPARSDSAREFRIFLLPWANHKLALVTVRSGRRWKGTAYVLTVCTPSVCENRSSSACRSKGSYMGPRELVFFDVDGVLLDSLPQHLRICADKASEF